MSHLANSFHFNLHGSHFSDIMCGRTVVIMDWNFLQNQVSHSMKTASLCAQGRKKKINKESTNHLLCFLIITSDVCVGV